MINLRQAGFYTAAIGFTCALYVFNATPAISASIKCSTLLSNVRKSGEKPKVVINDWMGIVTITGRSNSCKEPLEIWNNRRIKGYPTTRVSTKPKMPTQQPRRSAPTTSTKAPARDATPGDKSFGSNRKDQKNMTLGGPLVTRCELQLGDVWHEGKYDIGKSQYYLGRIFTIDSNHDGLTDNVGFVFQRTGRKDLQAYHNPSPGTLHIGSVAGLKSLPAGEIPLLCFGQINYNVPVEMVDRIKGKKATQAFAVPDLEQEMKARAAGKQTPEEIAAAEKKAADAGLGLGIWIGIAIGVLVLIGGVVFILARMGKIPFLRSMRKRSDEDFLPSSEDDDEEDG
jgi:hypothetical protein